MRQFAFVRDTEVDYFRVVRKDIVEDTDLPCPCRLTVGKKKEVSSKDTSEIQLPFGIAVDMPAAKGKETKKGGGAHDGDSSTDSDSSNVSLAAKKIGAKDGYSSAGDTSNSDAGSEPDGLPLPASIVIGIQLADHALSNRSVCWICKSNIPRGAGRIQYRIANSNSWERLRYVHVQCISGLPSDTRENDLRVAKSWLRKAGLTAERKTLFGNVVDRIRSAS